MNQTLSFRRFSLLFRKCILERPMGVLGCATAALGGTFLLYFFFESMGAFHPAQFISFTFGLFGGSCLMASVVFNQFSSEASGISYLTLPASNLEKWLVGVLITGLFIALFLGFYRLMDSFFVDLYHHKLNPKDPRYAVQSNSVYVYDFWINEEFYILLLICLGTMMTGGVIFNKMAFIKTAILLFILFGAIMLLNFSIAKTLIPNVTRANPFEGVVLNRGTEEAYIMLSPQQQTNLFWILGVAYPIGLLLTSFFKLKDKEI